MSEFTYEIPNEERFLKAILLNLKLRGHEEIVSLLSGSKCIIIHGNQFSRKRWNAFWTTIHFEIPIKSYEEIFMAAKVL